MEITYSTENINSFGGINFADSIISNISVYKTIDTSLGGRDINAVYSYSYTPFLFTDNALRQQVTNLEIVEFYNTRCKNERLFDEMNNDFLCVLLALFF